MSKKAAASLMAEVASSSDDESGEHRAGDESSNVLSFRDCLNGRTVLIPLVPDGILQSPKQLRAQIKSPLELVKRHKWLFANHRRQQVLPPIGTVVAECSPCGRVRLVLCCAAFACQRLATAPASVHMAHMSWGWAEVVMERVTRGRVTKVQVLLQRRACCAVRCACRASACRASACRASACRASACRASAAACVCCVFDACCSKRWLVLRCVAAHQRPHQARRGVHYCAQAAAAARVADGPDIVDSALHRDGVSVLCHLIADADGVNKRDTL
jgi:hypothetical protein